MASKGKKNEIERQSDLAKEKGRSPERLHALLTKLVKEDEDLRTAGNWLVEAGGLADEASRLVRAAHKLLGWRRKNSWASENPAEYLALVRMAKQLEELHVDLDNAGAVRPGM